MSQQWMLSRMRYSQRSFLIPAALVVGLLAVPAHAAARGPQVSDVCGDAQTGAQAHGQRYAVDDSSAARDLRSARVGVVGSALQATVQSCGPASLGVSYHASWEFTDGCWMDLGYLPRDLLAGSVAAHVTLNEECSSSGAAGSQARRVSTLTLPATAAVLKGSTVTLTVPLAKVPAVSQPRLRRGVIWTATAALAYDPELGSQVFAAGNLNDPDFLVSVRFDWATGRGYTVGER
jgi:hypothetical protein